jgi:molecular chaperone HscB
MNFFELYGLPEHFDVNQETLRSTYKALALVTHPDKFATGSDSEKLRAVQKSAQVNDGYQILKSPLSRAEHLIELRGVDLKHEQQTLQDTGFLMQQMELREQLEEIDSVSEPLEQLEQLDNQIAIQINEKLTDLAQILESVSDESNKKAADEVRKLKFLYKLRIEIERKEDNLSDF